jgi:hypothetical protein
MQVGFEEEDHVQLANQPRCTAFEEQGIVVGEGRHEEEQPSQTNDEEDYVFCFKFAHKHAHETLQIMKMNEMRQQGVRFLRETRNTNAPSNSCRKRKKKEVASLLRQLWGAWQSLLVPEVYVIRNVGIN